MEYGTIIPVARRLSTLVLHLSAKNPMFEGKKNPRLSAFYRSYLPERKNYNYKTFKKLL